MVTAMKLVEPSLAHENLRMDLAETLSKHKAEISSEEALAVVAYLCGQLIAVQDDRTTSTQAAIDIVQRNIVQGNRDTVADAIGAVRGNG